MVNMNLAMFYLVSIFLLILTFITGLASRNSDLKNRCIILFILVNIICLIIYTGKIPFAVLITAIALAGSIELLRQVYSSFLKSAIFAVLIFSGLVFTIIYISPPWFILTSFIPIYLLSARMNIGNKPNRTLVWACIFLVVIPGCLVMYYLYEINYVHIIALLLFVQFNDGFSYLAGRKFGKTHIKMISSISPNKTLEGYLGGIFGILASLLLLNTIIPAYPKEGMLLRSATLLMAVFVFANAGDLAFSSIKRKLKIKDFSSLLSNHGGVLDRFDSILFLAPIYLFIIKGGLL